MKVESAQQRIYLFKLVVKKAFKQINWLLYINPACTLMYFSEKVLLKRSTSAIKRLNKNLPSNELN